MYVYCLTKLCSLSIIIVILLSVFRTETIFLWFPAIVLFFLLFHFCNFLFNTINKDGRALVANVAQLTRKITKRTFPSQTTKICRCCLNNETRIFEKGKGLLSWNEALWFLSAPSNASLSKDRKVLQDLIVFFLLLQRDNQLFCNWLSVAG